MMVPRKAFKSEEAEHPGRTLGHWSPSLGSLACDVNASTHILSRINYHYQSLKPREGIRSYRTPRNKSQNKPFFTLKIACLVSHCCGVKLIKTKPMKSVARSLVNCEKGSANIKTQLKQSVSQIATS